MVDVHGWVISPQWCLKQVRRLKGGVRPLVCWVQVFLFSSSFDFFDLFLIFSFFLTSIAARFLVTFLVEGFLSRLRWYPIEATFFVCSFSELFDFFLNDFFI